MGATVDGTKRYFQDKQIESVSLGKTGWFVSPIGFGGYRVDDRTPAHADALRLSLRSGCNLIDTSSNYTDGGSERLVGEVLSELFGAGELRRDEVVVVTKAGYVQGENMLLARARIDGGRPFPDMVEYSPDCWHCISPEFLEEQITRSLQRLRLDSLDVVLLHNPEYFLKTKQDHAQYYERISKAFEFLEGEVKHGRIQYYGISSNAFPEPREADDYTSLETILENAGSGGSERFAVIQLPLNIFEPGAALEKNNSGQTVLEFAKESGLAVLINRPLNAFVVDRMIRLADFPDHVGENVTERLQQAMDRTAMLESRYPGKSVVPIQRIAWAHIIRENFGKLAELDRWRQILAYQIGPERDEAIEALAEHEAYRPWCAEYVRASDALFSAMTVFLEAQAAIQSRDLSARLDEASPRLKDSPTLSSKVVRIYRSLPGVSSVLVGMRRPEYVRDMIELRGPLDEDEAIRALGVVGRPG